MAIQADLLIALRPQHADIRQVAVVVGIVESVADNELVRDREAAKIGLQALTVAILLVEEGDRGDAGGVARGEELAQIFHRQAGVDDVLDDDDMAAGDVVVEILDQAHDTGGLVVQAIAGDCDEIHVDRAVHAAAEIDVEKGRALEHADEHGPLVAILGGQLTGELFHARGDGLFGEKDAFNILFRRSDEHKGPPA